MHKNKKRERGKIPTTHRVIPLVVLLSTAKLDRRGEQPEEKIMVALLLLRCLVLCDVCVMLSTRPIDWVSLLWSLVLERTLYLILLLIPMSRETVNSS